MDSVIRRAPHAGFQINGNRSEKSARRKMIFVPVGIRESHPIHLLAPHINARPAQIMFHHLNRNGCQRPHVSPRPDQLTGRLLADARSFADL